LTLIEIWVVQAIIPFINLFLLSIFKVVVLEEVIKRRSGVIFLFLRRE